MPPGRRPAYVGSSPSAKTPGHTADSLPIVGCRWQLAERPVTALRKYGRLVRTIYIYRYVARRRTLEAVRLRGAGVLAERRSTRSVRLARMILIHAIRNAMVTDLVVRNVADLAAVPLGSPGWPSGGPPDATDIRMESKRITERAGLGRDWTPRELRHTFVPLRPDSGVPIEQIADAVGHSSTRASEVVYRHQLWPVTRTAAIAPGPLFETRGKTNGGQN